MTKRVLVPFRGNTFLTRGGQEGRNLQEVLVPIRGNTFLNHDNVSRHMQHICSRPLSG